MADPLSIAASVIDVLGASYNTTLFLRIVEKFRHTDLDLISLLNEISGLQTQLRLVALYLKLVKNESLENEKLKNCLQDIDRLRLEASITLLVVYEFVQKILREIYRPGAESKSQAVKT